MSDQVTYWVSWLSQLTRAGSKGPALHAQLHFILHNLGSMLWERSAAHSADGCAVLPQTMCAQEVHQPAGRVWPTLLNPNLCVNANHAAPCHKPRRCCAASVRLQCRGRCRCGQTSPSCSKKHNRLNTEDVAGAEKDATCTTINECPCPLGSGSDN